MEMRGAWSCCVPPDPNFVRLTDGDVLANTFRQMKRGTIVGKVSPHVHFPYIAWLATDKKQR